MDGWLDEWIDGWIDGWMDGWIDGWIGRWMDHAMSAEDTAGSGECNTAPSQRHLQGGTPCPPR